MRSTTVKELQWLHDSDVLSIQYDTSGDAGWSILLTMRCPNDSGYAPWEGKCVVLSAANVVGSKHLVYGVAGREEFDRINVGVSRALRESALKGRPSSTQFNFEFTINFISGSMLEVVCQQLQVEIEQ